jgi:3-hydroxyacyl-CoA dehydrogenase/enoyl-CoA hydratase/3-hydroxybutyryl-CoA epimerase
MSAVKLAHAELGPRMRLPPMLDALHADGRKGRKNARGFYLHGTAAPRRATVDPTVYSVVDIRPTARRPSAPEIAERCILSLVNEAIRCLGDGVLRSARDGDVGAVFGVGFPAFRGGPFRYVDRVGHPELLRRLRSLEERFGARFEPAPLLVEMARGGKRFYA